MELSQTATCGAAGCCGDGSAAAALNFTHTGSEGYQLYDGDLGNFGTATHTESGSASFTLHQEGQVIGGQLEVGAFTRDEQGSDSVTERERDAFAADADTGIALSHDATKTHDHHWQQTGGPSGADLPSSQASTHSHAESLTV